MEVSGQSLVPVLVRDDDVVADSPRILDWLEEQYPDPSLYPDDPARRAEVRIFVEWFNRVWKIAPNRLVEEEDGALAAEMRAALVLFEGLLAGRDYLFGTFGAADVVAFPFLKYAVFGLPEGDDEPFHAVLVDHQPLRPDSPLRAWAQRVDAHPRA